MAESMETLRLQHMFQLLSLFPSQDGLVLPHHKFFYDW